MLMVAVWLVIFAKSTCQLWIQRRSTKANMKKIKLTHCLVINRTNDFLDIDTGKYNNTIT